MKKQKEKKDEKVPSTTLEKPKIVELKDNPEKVVQTEKKDIVEEVKKEVKKTEEPSSQKIVKSDIVTESKIDPKYTAISTYNGDSCDNYNWSQGTNDVSIQINLLPNTSASKVK